MSGNLMRYYLVTFRVQYEDGYDGGMVIVSYECQFDIDETIDFISRELNVEEGVKYKIEIQNIHEMDADILMEKDV